MLEKLLKISMVFCLCFALAGCAPLNFQNVSDLLRAPALGSGQGEIQKALAASLNREPQYKYPKEGPQRSPLLMADLNGDGTDEGILAYSLPGPAAAASEGGGSVFLAVLEQTDGIWNVKQTVQGKGVEVASLQVADLLGNGSKQLLVGYANANLTGKVLELLQYQKDELTLALNMPYSGYELGDFTGRGGTDLVVVSPSDQLAGMQLQFVSTLDGAFGELQQPVPLDINFESCSGIYPSKGADGRPLIVLDGVIKDGNVNMLASQLIYYSGEHFFADAGTLRGKSGRISPLLKSRDIDGDGIVEIPRRMGQEIIETPRADKNLEYVEWWDFTMAETAASPEPITKQFGVLDADRGVYVKMPKAWREKIEVVDGNGAGEWRVKDLQTRQTLLTLRVLEAGAATPEGAIALVGQANTYILFGEAVSAAQANEVQVVTLV